MGPRVKSGGTMMTAPEPGERAAGSEGLIGAGSADAPAAPPSVPAAAEQRAPERGTRRLDGHTTSPLVLSSLVTPVDQIDTSIIHDRPPLIKDTRKGKSDESGRGGAERVEHYGEQY